MGSNPTGSSEEKEIYPRDLRGLVANQIGCNSCVGLNPTISTFYHSETKDKMSNAAKEKPKEKHTQFGTCWIIKHYLYIYEKYNN